jgi:hypothetical protein
VPPCQSTLILTVNNPCATTSITIAPSIFEDLVAFIGYTTSSKSLYTYNDSESVARTVNTDVVDLCGEKKLLFMVNGTTTTYLYAQNSDFIYFSPPADSTEYGTSLATV